MPPERAGAGIRARTVWLVAISTVAGGFTGVVASTFAVLLDGDGRLRNQLVERAHAYGLPGLLLVLLVVAAMTVAAAMLVHRVEPHAEGSGIPRVGAIVRGRAEPERLRVLPVKYVGGLLAIGGGLALGREGPSVQMGGVIASLCARGARMERAEMRMVVAAGAAAGLATAFNAPIAGGVFVLEELIRRFDPTATLATLAASGAGFAATHLLRADGTTFVAPTLPSISFAQSPEVLAVGVVCGLLGVAYNRSIMAGLRFVDTSRIPVPTRAAVIGIGVGLVAWCAPSWVGGGDGLTQRALNGRGALGSVLVLIAVRFVLGVVSYAANTPGGLFAPMLALGSQAGLAVALVAGRLFEVPASISSALALAGFAAFFTACVQAPVTGLVLTTEMTGSVSWLPPMLGAVAISMLVARLFGGESIYDALTARSARSARINSGRRAGGALGRSGRPPSVGGPGAP